MIRCRTDTGNDTFPDTGDDRRFTGTADETVYISPHRDPGPYFEFDAILGHCGNKRRFNDLRIDTHLYGFQNIPAGQVDSAGPFKGQGHGRPVSSNQGIDNAVYITAGQIMSFQLIDIDIETGLIRFDQRQDNLGRNDAAHANEIDNAHGNAGCHRRNPQSQWYEMEKQGNNNDRSDNNEQRRCQKR